MDGIDVVAGDCVWNVSLSIYSHGVLRYNVDIMMKLSGGSCGEMVEVAVRWLWWWWWLVWAQVLWYWCWW